MPSTFAIRKTFPTRFFHISESSDFRFFNNLSKSTSTHESRAQVRASFDFLAQFEDALRRELITKADSEKRHQGRNFDKIREQITGFHTLRVHSTYVHVQSLLTPLMYMYEKKKAPRRRRPQHRRRVMATARFSQN